MPADVRARFETRRPLDLELTLGPLAQGPCLRITTGEVWRASHTPDGPATLHLVRSGPGVNVEAWGPGATWAAGQAAALCGEEDDDVGFSPRHPFLAQVYKRNPGLRIPKTRAVFEALVPAILEQKVTGIEARRSYRALMEALGEPAPGPARLTVPPSPHLLARTPYWTLHRFGIERRRAEAIIGAARSAARLEETVAMSMPAAYQRLEAFTGVGPWTAAQVAAVALGDADAVPVGDYNLPHSIGYALEGTVRSTDKRMLELLNPYRGHRGRVIRLIGLAGISAPRFGPRMPLRDIAHN
ncbi:MAG: DNA-3-methyladenine glycosylase 2 family protein [Candidatus Dormibacteraeota bacterium]|nr:DNA-3-methyladenine glycosylase 2 family protein [Candidatus Dormibacteraeota bacterium]